MSSGILGLRTAIYHVADLQAARDWYTQQFGVAPYFDEPFYVGFDIGGYELGLLPSESSSTGKEESVVAYWGVGNIQEAYDRFLSRGAIEWEAPTEVGEGIVVAKVKDPWGNVIGLIYNPNFHAKV